jgi:hypothetical protein
MGLFRESSLGCCGIAVVLEVWQKKRYFFSKKLAGNKNSRIFAAA